MSRIWSKIELWTSELGVYFYVFIPLDFHRFRTKVARLISDLLGSEWSGSKGKSTPSTKITIWGWERCGALVSIYGTCTKLGCLRPDYADTLPRALSQCSGKILSRAPSSRIPKSVQLGHHIVDLNGYTALRLLLFRIDLIQYKIGRASCRERV